MIKAVFFDLYNTLVHFWPPLDEIQQASCKELGLNVSKKGIRKGYGLADEFMSLENAKYPLAERTAEERDRFFGEYERLILKGAGVDVSEALAAQVWWLASQVPKDFDLFDDVVPALELLKTRGIALGIISNLRRNMDDLCRQLGIDPYMDFCVTSADVGAEKPDPRIFQAALQKARVDSTEAMHVGDQYQTDVQGAKAVGMIPVLIDRESQHENVNDCSRITQLRELDGLVVSIS